MKVIKDINHLILKKIIEIVFVVGFVFYSTSLWNLKENKNIFASVFYYNNFNYTKMEIENTIDYNMYPMSDSNALENLSPCSIKIINETSNPEFYLLTLKISKNSTLDYHYLHISLGSKIYSLEDLEMKEEQDSYYFILDEDTIMGMIKSYEIRLWMKQDVENDQQAKQLIISFEIINGVTQL